MIDYINVSYKVYTTYYGIAKKLNTLTKIPILSLDLELQSIYSISEREEAKLLLKNNIQNLTRDDMLLCKVVARASGLSHPSITKITHIIFGLSESESIIFIINDNKSRDLVLNWVINFKGKLLIHNTGFDLKIIHYHTNNFPKDFEDTQLLAKCLINHCDNWKANTGLKELMSSYYDPKWLMIESYDIQNYKDKAFLRYSAIDGAATFKLWEQLQEAIKDEK